MIVPSGDPVWVRSANLTVYGGNVNKMNHLSQGKIDSLTDVGAEEFSRMAGDLASVAATAPFLTMTFTCNDSGTAAPTINVVHSMTGVLATGYAGGSPPSGFPSAARNGNGDVTFTFASSYTDQYGSVGAFVAQHPRGSIVATTPAIVVCKVLTATTVQVKAFDTSGAAISNAIICFTLHSGS